MSYTAFCQVSACRCDLDPEFYRLLLVGDQPKLWMRTDEEFDVPDASTLDELTDNLISELRKFGDIPVVIRNTSTGGIATSRYLGGYTVELERRLNIDELSFLFDRLRTYWADVEQADKAEV